MADQVNLGTVHVENASATVRHTWQTALVSITGTFLQGETLSWAGGGAGVVSRWDTGSNTLFFYRTAGPFPVVGDTLTSSGTGVGDVSELGPASPPNWNLLLVGESDIRFAIDGNTSVYKVSGAPSQDTLDLTVVYGESDEHEANYGLHTAETPDVPLPLVDPGDVAAPQLISEGMVELARRLKWRGARRSLSVAQSVTTGAWREVSFDTDDRDTDSFAGADGELVIPAGGKTADLAFSVKLASAQTLKMRILKNAAVFEGMGEVDFGSVDVGNLVVPAVDVQSGDIFTAEVTVGANVDIESDDQTWFRIQLTELT